MRLPRLDLHHQGRQNTLFRPNANGAQLRKAGVISQGKYSSLLQGAVAVSQVSPSETLTTAFNFTMVLQPVSSPVTLSC